MKYKVTITATAKQDLREIAVWIARKSENREAAKAFISELQAEIRKREMWPEAGAVPKDRVLISAGFRYVVHNDYLVFYSIEENGKTVYILSVFSAGKNDMRVMKELL